MALLEPFMVKTFDVAAADAAAHMDLKADTGQSLLIKELGMRSNTVEWGEVLIDRLDVGWFKIGASNAQNHLWHCVESSPMPNLLTHLGNLGIFKGYPVAEGETFHMGHVGENFQWGRIVYEIHDAGDITAELPNGSKSPEFTFINYGTNKSLGAQAKYVALDESLNPTEYPAFPFGAVVPSKTEIDIHGVLFMDWAGRIDNTAANHTWLKFATEREVMFDEDRRGIYSSQGMSYFVWHSKQTNVPFVPFPKPYTFTEGQELNISLLESNVGTITIKDALIATIQTVRKVT